MRGKSRPSSSSQAASMVQTTGMNVGFGGYIGNSRVDAVQPEDAYMNVDGESAANLRRLSKKDTTTKLKALSALNISFREFSVSEIVTLLPCWVFEYKRLVYDNSRQIREATHKAMLSIVTTIGRSLAPHLKSLIGPWWVAHCDPFTEVSEAARQAFQSSFPEPKRRLEALLFCAKDILAHIDENLKLTPQTISDKSTPLDEATEKYERVIASSLLALAAFLDVLLSSTVNRPSQKDSPAKLASLKESAVGIFRAHKLFQGFFKAGNPRIRAAAYQTMQSYMRHAPEVITENLDSVAKSVLGGLGEKDPSCHKAMWDMILMFSRSYDRAWEGSGLRKAIYPRLWSFLRQGCYGSLKISYPCILPLLSLIPATAISPAEGFFVEFFTNLWSGCEQGMWSSDDGKLLLDTMKECLSWVVTHGQRYTSSETDAASLQVSVVETVCLRLLFRTYIGTRSKEQDLPKSSLLKSPEFIEQVGICAVDILSSLDEHLLAPFWISFLEDCSSVLQQSDEPPVTRMTQFLVLINNEKLNVLTNVVKPLVLKEFFFIKESERSDAVKLLSRLVTSYGPFAFESLASSNWTQGHPETDLTTTFAVKYLEYFFKKEIVPWCMSGEVNELKLDLLLSFLEHDTFFKDWDYVLSLIPDNSVDLLATILREVQKRCQNDKMLDRWRSSRIDQAVLAVANSSGLCQLSCANLIRGSLMGVESEDGNRLILSNDAVVKLLEKLLILMASSADISAQPLTKVLLSTFLPENPVPVTFHAARSAIDIVLSEYPTLRALEYCSSVLAKVFATMACLYWAYIRPTLPDPNRDADDVRTEPVKVPGETEGEADFVISLLVARQMLPDICKDSSTECWNSMQDFLITSIKEAVCTSAEEDMHKSGAAWILDLSTCLDSPQLLQATLDRLLAPNKYWPVHVGLPDSPTQAEMHRRFCSMVYHVGLGVGLEALVLGSNQDGQPGFRPWVVTEFLCTWEWTDGSAREFVLPFLQACAKNNESEALVDKVLEDLFLKSRDADASKSTLYCCWRSQLNYLDPFLRGLLAVLGTIVGEDGFSAKFIRERIFCKYLSTMATSVSIFVLPCILDILMPTLRKRSVEDATLPADDLQSTVCTWLKVALGVPPLIISNDAENVQRVQIAVACFPVDINGGATALLRASGAEVSKQERDYLLRLLQKQYPGKSTAEAGFDEVKQLALAKLMGAAICYCWESLGAEEWSFILGQLRKWLQKGVIDAEEFTESLTDAKPEATSENFGNFDNATSVELLGTAVNVLSLAKAMHSLEKAADSDSLRSLDEAQWQSFDSRATDNILRLLLATGLAEAVADGNPGAVEIVSSQRIQQTYVWDQVANIALSASDRVRDTAVRAANLWGLRKSAISGLYALMFSRHPLPSLQWVSFKFLSTDPLQHQAITWQPAGGTKEDDDNGDDEKAAVSDDIRPELRAVIDTPASILLESPLTSSRRIHYFLAWSLFVTHFQSLETSSQARDRLLQYTQDSDGPSTLLDCLFQHIGLKRMPKKKDVIESAAVAEAANRAARTGSILFAVEGLWGGGKDELAILAGALYGFLLRVLPARVRSWYTGLRDKNTTAAVETFTTMYCSTELLKEEFSQVQAAAVLSDGNMTIMTNTKLQEVTTTYKKEDTGMDMVIRFPKSYPLKPVEVECTGRMGMTEMMIRKWILSMVAFLRNQNGAVAEAIGIWKKNLDHEFEGVEECPICYSILHTTNHGLPRLACKTCKHKFHAACLYKWFSSSHKSNCPLCQTPF